MVLRVRFTTVPALMMRSNSKQPFWLTGDITSTLALAVLVWCMPGVSSFMPAERMACVGWVGMGMGSSVVAMLAEESVTFTVGGVRRYGRSRLLGAQRCARWQQLLYPDCYGRWQDGRRGTGGMLGARPAPASRGAHRLQIHVRKGTRVRCGAVRLGKRTVARATRSWLQQPVDPGQQSRETDARRRAACDAERRPFSWAATN